MDVSFVIQEPDADLIRLETLDPDAEWRDFVTTTRAWVLQTYLRLQAAGVPVRLRNTLPRHGIAIFSAGDYNSLRQGLPIGSGALMVAVRGSHRRTPYFADVEIVQNPAQADNTHRHFMTHWPQPGLLPRDRSRGSRIERLCFKGFPVNLRAEFREPPWTDFLDRHGLHWVHDAVPYQDLQTRANALDWNDYRTIDLVVAVRPHDAKLHPERPATKLYNAWLAGVPALLGPEIAYRALRRHPDDYLEVYDRESTQAAVIDLMHNPGRYRAMIEQAQLRAGEFDVAMTTWRWRQLLTEVLPELAARWRPGSLRNQPLWLQEIAGRLCWAWRGIRSSPHPQQWTAGW